MSQLWGGGVGVLVGLGWMEEGGEEYYSLVPSSLGSRRGGLGEAILGGGRMKGGLAESGWMDHGRR